jgi:Kdo2-lipid IVA lauroyltransferase/acyltransferase
MDKKKPGPVRTVGYILEAVIVITLGTIFSRLPKRTAGCFGILAGTLLFHFDRKNKKWADHNLDIIFKEPPLSPIEKIRIVRELYVNVAKLAFEFLQLYKCTSENLPEYLQTENFQVVDKALGEKKGMLLISAHLGNWEYLCVLGSRRSYKVAVVVKRQHNPYTDRWLTKIREEKGGAKCFYHGKELNHRIRIHLKQNGILGLLADQRQIPKHLMTPFFGMPSATTDGPAKLHLWYGAPIVFAFSIKQPDGKYLVQLDGPYHFERSGDYRSDCSKITNFINQKYETMIKKYPEQWLSLLTPRWEIP